jgi:hypothetical protein
MAAPLQEQLTQDLLGFMRRCNRSGDETLVVPNDYLRGGRD